MLLFPNCKINLGLKITRKREDGYHDLETIFYPIVLKDALEAIKSALDKQEPGVTFSGTGLPISGNPEDNLCVKAWHILKNDFPDLPSIQLHLHKVIPMGAGLGGGSSDGAFTLQLLNQLFQLGLSQQQLIAYALRLGSDCPFFILNKPCFATGRGEKMEVIDMDLSGYRFVLVNPNIHLSTAQAFSQIKPGKPPQSISEIIQRPIQQWKDLLLNDFEISISHLHPVISEIKQELYQKGAVYASMTGSGSTVYGIFEKISTPTLSFNANWQVFFT